MYEGSRQHLESLQLSLAEESRQRKLVEQRFQDLAKNHEHMIHLKDEYKQQALSLQQQRGQDKLTQEARLEQEQAREREVRELEGRVRMVEEERDGLKQEADTLESVRKDEARQHAELVQQLQDNLKGQYLTPLDSHLITHTYNN